MFLSRVGGKSQFAFLPLGLGSAFGILSTQAIANPPAKQQLKDLSHLTLLTKISPASTSKDALDASMKTAVEETAIDLSFLQSSTATSSFVRVDSRYEPTFLAKLPKQKQIVSLEKVEPESLFKQSQPDSAPSTQAEEAELNENLDKRLLNARSLALSKIIDAIDLNHVASKRSEDELTHEPSPAGPSVTPVFSEISADAPQFPAASDAALEESSFSQPSALESLLPYESQPSAQSLARPLEQTLAQTVIDSPIAQQPISELAESELGQALPVIPLERPDASTEGNEDSSESDDELGRLRLRLERSLSEEDEDLGILRTIQTARSQAAPPKPPTAFLSGRLGFFDTDNAFRISQFTGGDQTIDSQISQAGLSLLFFPRLSETTSLYAIAETNIARYSDNEVILFDTNGNERNPPIRPNYNEVELQLGLRQKLFSRTYAQLGWRHQVLFGEGYRKRRFTADYIDARLSHRAVLNSKTWLDGVYQARLGFTSSARSDRFRQTFTVSLNHAFNKDLRTSLLYQLDLADYTRTPRFDNYQQIFGTVSYNLTPETRISLFAGTRFGNSTGSNIILDDTFYGASLNVTVPLF